MLPVHQLTAPVLDQEGIELPAQLASRLRLSPVTLLAGGLFALTLGACATVNPKPGPDAWLLSPGWKATAKFKDSNLKGRSGQLYAIEGSAMENLKVVALDLAKQSGLHPRMALTAAEGPNAFASRQQIEGLIGLTLPMLHGIGADRDALATTIGHELAHLKLKHGDIRQERSDMAKGVGNVLGSLLTVAGVPLGGLVASLGVGVVTTAYSREEERDADMLGLEWAVAAGYSACGVVRTMALLNATQAGASLPFLSSHPGQDERIQRANQFAIRETGKAC
jgi:Zn-dependent protease with chaperone function